LKSFGEVCECDLVTVTPFTGVWIEIRKKAAVYCYQAGHTLHGCVD